MPVAVKSNARRNKHFILNQSRLKKAQKILGTRTETEAIERALELVITDDERNRMAWDAHDKFLKELIESGGEIKDVFGRLKDE